MRLNHRQIEAFRAVFQTGGMTAAGALLGVTQPAVSRLIRDLEAETGLALFDRKGGAIAPTPEAIALYNEVQRSFHGLDQVARAATELRRQRSQTLRIAASVGPSFFCLPPVITDFHRKHPDVVISLQSCSSPEVMDLVASHRCDIGVAVVPAQGPGVEIEALPGQNVVCILPPDHPLTRKRVIRPKDLADVPLMMISEYSLMRQRILQSFEAAGVAPKIVLDSSYSGAICSLVADGVGVSVLDPVTARAYAGRGIVLRRYEPAVPYELKLVHSALRVTAGPAGAFADILRHHLKAA